MGKSQPTNDEELKALERTLQTKISEINRLIIEFAKLNCKVEITNFSVSTFGTGQHEVYRAAVYKRI